jgi:microcystin-dependent protein
MYMKVRKSLLLPSSFIAFLAGMPLMGHACGETPYVGEICTFAFDFCPRGFLRADGTLYPVGQHSALFSLLGTNFGGNGSTTFGVPDLRGRVMVGTGFGPGLTPVAIGQQDGQESTMLTAANVAPHTHGASFTGGTVSGSANITLSNLPVSSQTVSGNVTVNALNGATTPTGGQNIPDGTHNTVGKFGPNAFYPAGGSQVAVPASHNLSVSPGTVSGTATGTVANLPVNGGTVTVAPNVATPTPVSTLPPRLGLTVCIAENGVYPARP